MLPFFKYPTGTNRYDELHSDYIARYGGNVWPLDDKVGSTTITDLRLTSTGTVNSTVTFQSSGPPIAKDISKCASFANSGYIALSGVSSPASTFSFSAWINCTNPSSATEQFIYGYRLANNNRFNISIASGNIRTSFATAANTNFQKSGAITTGWHHVGLFKITGGSAPTLYIDGVLQTGTTSPTNSNTTGSNIGARSDNSLLFTGSICWVSIFPVTLNSANIIELYKVGLGG